MDEKPRRRWFRFRLSTVLILTAIAAWGMATRPRFDWGYREEPSNFFDRTKRWSIAVSTDDNPEELFDTGLDNITLCVTHTWETGWEDWWISISPKSMLYPALALAAFLAWKAAWAVVQRHRGQSNARE